MELHLFMPSSPAFRMAIKITDFVTSFEKMLMLKHFIGKIYYSRSLNLLLAEAMQYFVKSNPYERLYFSCRD